MPIRIGGPGESLVNRAADAAFNHVEEFVVAEGREVESVFIVIRLVSDDSGEVDTTAAGNGFEDEKEVFSTLLSCAVQTGKELGLTVVVAPLGKG